MFHVITVELTHLGGLTVHIQQELDRLSTPRCVSTGVGAVAIGMLTLKSKSAMVSLCINLKGRLSAGYGTVEMLDLVGST